MSGYVDKDTLYPPSSEEVSVPWVVARQEQLRHEQLRIEGGNNWSVVLLLVALGILIWSTMKKDDDSSGSGDQF